MVGWTYDCRLAYVNFRVIFLNPAAGSHGENVNSTRFWAVLLAE